MVLVGNPRPTLLQPLPFAEKEAITVEEILNRAWLEMLQEHFFRSNRSNPFTTKGRMKQVIQVAGWAHLACHGNIDTDSLVFSSTCRLCLGREIHLSVSVQRVAEHSSSNRRGHWKQ